MASIKSDVVADTKEHLDQSGHYEDVPPLPASLTGLTPDELAKVEKRAILKLDLVIMPAITILYILNYLDRQNLAASKLANIEEDLGLTTQQFNTAISILFVGYSSCPHLVYQLVHIANPSQSLDAGSVQPPSGEDQLPYAIHQRRCSHLGCHICLYGTCAELRGIDSLSIHARICKRL